MKLLNLIKNSIHNFFRDVLLLFQNETKTNGLTPVGRETPTDAGVTPVVDDLTTEQKNKIKRILDERGVSQPCPRCSNKNFTMAKGYFSQPIQAQLSGYLEGRALPSIAIICDNCGYISQHALGSLGLLPPAVSESQEGNKNE
jgi:predicted nucleic-acid-binding Zn-ribbon protein